MATERRISGAEKLFAEISRLSLRFFFPGRFVEKRRGNEKEKEKEKERERKMGEERTYANYVHSSNFKLLKW